MSKLLDDLAPIEIDAAWARRGVAATVTQPRTTIFNNLLSCLPITLLGAKEPIHSLPSIHQQCLGQSWFVLGGPPSHVEPSTYEPLTFLHRGRLWSSLSRGSPSMRRLNSIRNKTVTTAMMPIRAHRSPDTDQHPRRQWRTTSP